MTIQMVNHCVVNYINVCATISSIKMNFGFLPKFITIRCMVINFSAHAEVHHRASLRSAIFSIQVLWMDALRMMDMVCAEVSKMRMVIGIPNLIVIGLLLLLIKNYRYCLTRLKMGLRAIVPSWLVFILRRLSVY